MLGEAGRLMRQLGHEGQQLQADEAVLWRAALRILVQHK